MRTMFVRVVCAMASIIGAGLVVAQAWNWKYGVAAASVLLALVNVIAAGMAIANGKGTT